MAASAHSRKQDSTKPAPTADTTTTADQQVATTTPATTPTPVPAKAKTPEQQAAAMRREAGELTRAAKVLGENTESGKSLLTRAGVLNIEADTLAPRKTKPSAENRPICAGTKKDGTACTAHAMADSEFCTDHRPVRARFTDAEWAAFQAIPTEQIVNRIGWGVALKMAKEALKANTPDTK